MVVVDLSIENDPYGTVFVAEGLMARSEVDDAQAAHAKPDPALREDALVVRTAVGHDVAHAAQRAGVDVCVRAEFKYACNSTHTVFLTNPPCSRRAEATVRNQEIQNQRPPLPENYGRKAH